MTLAWTTNNSLAQEELAAQRQDFGSAKEKSFKKKVKVERQNYLAKMTSAEQTKEERIENEQRLAEFKLTRRLSALEKKETVKKQLELSQRKMDSHRMQKIKAVRLFVLCFCRGNGLHAPQLFHWQKVLTGPMLHSLI